MSTAKMNRCVSACVVSTIAAVMLSWADMATQDWEWSALAVIFASVSLALAVYVAAHRYG